MIEQYPFEVMNGPENMATDEAMLMAAVEGRASMRVYSWQEATASLGYFQPVAHRPKGLPYVRRSTGGGTIIHHHDITYALALPAGKDWQTDEPWPCKMHHVLQRVLQELGIESEAVVCGREQKLGDALCFEDQTAGDVRLNGHKVAGSAQRKYKGALMQHGSVLLARSEYATQLPGLLELTGQLLEPKTLGERWLKRLTDELNWNVVNATWDGKHREWREEIMAEKYGNPEWNEKR